MAIFRVDDWCSAVFVATAVLSRQWWDQWDEGSGPGACREPATIADWATLLPPVPLRKLPAWPGGGHADGCAAEQLEAGYPWVQARPLPVHGWDVMARWGSWWRGGRVVVGQSERCWAGGGEVGGRCWGRWGGGREVGGRWRGRAGGGGAGAGSSQSALSYRAHHVCALLRPTCACQDHIPSPCSPCIKDTSKVTPGHIGLSFAELSCLWL